MSVKYKKSLCALTRFVCKEARHTFLLAFHCLICAAMHMQVYMKEKGREHFIHFPFIGDVHLLIPEEGNLGRLSRTKHHLIPHGF